MGNHGLMDWRWHWRFVRADVAEPRWLLVGVLSSLPPLFMNAPALFCQCFAPAIVLTERTLPFAGLVIAHQQSAFELAIDPVAKALDDGCGPVQPQPFLTKVVLIREFGAPWV